MYRWSETDGILRNLGRLEALRARLDLPGTLPRVWTGLLRRDLKAEAVAASTSMEGVNVTADDVRRILADDTPATVTPEDAALVRGYRDAMGFVLARADDEHFAWQRELILGIHYDAMGRSFANEAGRIRTAQNWLTNRATGEQVYLPPPAEDVPHLLDELAVWLEAEDAVPVAVRAAMAHVRLAGIHPFKDGNGRTARIVTSLVMYRGGYKRTEFTSLEEWWGRHLDSYYGAFACIGREWTEKADVTKFVESHLGAQVAQVEALSAKIAAEREVWTGLENLASDMRLDGRVAFVLFDGLFGRTITNRYYRNLADISSPTAVADLSALVATGLLHQVGAGRSTSYRGTFELLQRVALELGLDPERYASHSVGASADVMVRDLARQL